MRALIAGSARHSSLVLVLTVAIVITGGWCFCRLPEDALPDYSDRQVIVITSFESGAQLVQERVTRPISLALESIAGVVGVRGASSYGESRIYATVEEKAAIGTVRAEIAQTLDQLRPQLPEGTVPRLGPDANATGWIYQYALIDRTGKRDGAELRDLQDWTIRPELQKVRGLTEVATVGGYTSQFQVVVDPAKLSDLAIRFDSVVMAIRQANNDMTARTLDFGGQQFTLRSPGQLSSAKDIQSIVLASPHLSMEARMEHVTNRPIVLGDVAHVQVGPDRREGVASLNGRSEVVGGIAIARQGSDAAAVVRDLKVRIARLQTMMPTGVQIVTVYDRSKLVDEVVRGFGRDLLAGCLIVTLVILFFLTDFASALGAVMTIPICLAMSGIAMRAMHLELNMATLTGLALSIGILVDGAIIQVENLYYTARVDEQRKQSPRTVIVSALSQVSPRVFLAISIVVVAFLPALALTGAEGRIFRPLVLAKTAAMLAAAVCAVIINPALCAALSRWWSYKRPMITERLMNTISGGYAQILRVLLPRHWFVMAAVFVLMEFTIPSWLSLGTELLPPFEEGSRLFMPTTAPGISIAAVKDLLQRQTRALLTVPEVETVFAKAGRADTATDPAPLEMIEANIELRPEAEWRKRPRWYTGRVPDALADRLLRPLWPDRISSIELQDEMDQATRFPGMVNAWTSPIMGRAEMLASGSRTPLLLKVIGPSTDKLDILAKRIRKTIALEPGTSFVYAEPPQNGFFLDVAFDRDKLKSAGLPLEMAQSQIFPMLGGVTATTIYEHSIPRAVQVRYPSDYRDTIDAIRQLEVEDANGNKMRVGSIASVQPQVDLMLIRSEGGMPANYLYIGADAADLVSYTARLKKMVAERVILPQGYSTEWGGRFSDIERLHARLLWIVPGTICLIFALLWLGTRSLFYALLILLAVPFSLTGSVWFLSLLHYKLSAASWIGLLALFGLDAETGIFMVLFLDIAWKRRVASEGRQSLGEMQNAVIDGAARRLRPKLMTVVAAFCGMLPILLSQTSGSDFMRRLIAPMCGGLASSFLLELLVYPVIFFAWRRKDIVVKP